METILMILAISAMNVCCFALGAKVGQTVIQNREIELPSVDPFKAYNKHQEKAKMDAQKSKIEAIMRNIDNYDGTAFGQEDIP